MALLLMHSKIDQPTPPKHGDTRITVHRAWLPRSIGDMRIWLETYEQLEVYEVRTIAATLAEQPVAVKISGWHVVSEKPIKWTSA